VRSRAGAAARSYLSESRFGANVLEAQRYQSPLRPRVSVDNPSARATSATKSTP